MSGSINNTFRNLMVSLVLAGSTGLAFAGDATITGSTPSTSQHKVLEVTIDRAKVIRTDQPADTIIIGNPAIVDATIQDSHTLVLTGRSFGVTNLIVLNSNGDPVIDETVVVKSHETHTVRIYRRSLRETLACSPVCEPTLTIGDNPTTFENALQQISARNKLSQPSQK